MSKQKKTVEETNVQTETQTSEVTVTEKAKAQAAQIQELMAQGLSLEEALSKVTTKKGRERIDRIAYIQGLNNISELRKARKTAYAKKSKSKDKPEAAARYEEEIKEATNRLNEVLAEVNASPIPWKAALEHGDTEDGALQLFIQDLEKEVDEAWEKFLGAMDPKPTKAEVKVFTQGTTITDATIPDELKGVYNKRISNRDQRLYSLAQKAAALKEAQEGTRPLTHKVKETAPEKPKAKKAEGKGINLKKEGEEA